MKSVVYRIQDNEGRGPWRPGFSDTWVIEREDLYNLVPWILDIGDVMSKATRGRHLGCGCLTIDQLKRWFTPPEYSKLKLFGYRCVILSDAILLGYSPIQCVFERVKPLNKDLETMELYT